MNKIFLDQLNLGSILRGIRLNGKLTQVELSKKLKIAQSYLSEIENNNKPMTLEVLYAYASMFDIRPSKIFKLAEKKWI